MPQVGFPYTDPGSLMGGIRQHEAVLNGLQADAFRSGSQSQNVGQAARAFSGSDVDNNQTQTATLTQTAEATGTKNVTINTVLDARFEQVALPAYTHDGQVGTAGTLVTDPAVFLRQTEFFGGVDGGDSFDITINDVTAGGGSVTETYTFASADDSIQDLIDFINGNASFDGVTASFDAGTGRLLLTADEDDSRSLSITLDTPILISAFYEPTQTVTSTLLVDGQEGSAAPAGFDDSNNFLQRYIASASATDLLARGAANAAQDQGGDQSAFGKLNGFLGSDKSDADNALTQNESLTQNFDVDLDTNVTNTTDGSGSLGLFDSSRFRSIHAITEDSAAQAIFTSGQRQGSSDNPFSQVAVTDGAEQVTNTVTQNATLTQDGSTGGNGVRSTSVFDLRRNEISPLSFRSTDLLASIKENSAVNSSAASQEQAIVQSVAGGVDEEGNQTENGGTALNTGTSNATASDAVDVLNSVSVLI